MKMIAWIVLAGAMVGVPVRLAAAESGPPPQAEPAWPPFIMAGYGGPPVSETTEARYKEMADCGFNVAMIPTSKPEDIDTAANRRILDACKATGLKAIVRDRRIADAVPAAPNFAKDLDAAIADYSSHPALAGYFVMDEPCAKDFPRLKAICERLAVKDPRHLPHVNLFPNYCDRARLGGSYEQHVSRFIEQVKPLLVSWDHYALEGKKGQWRPIYFDNLEIVRREALKAGVPYIQILQCMPHWSFRDPTEAEYRWQVYTSLAYGCRGFMYYRYWSRDLGPGIIERNGKPGKRYEIIKRLNGRVKTLVPTLIRLKSAGVYHSEPLPKGTQKLAAEAPVKKMEGGAMVLGWLKNDAGADYLFVVNRSYKDKIKAQLTLDPAVKKVEELSQETGKPAAAAFTAGALSTDLEAGEGRLFKLAR